MPRDSVNESDLLVPKGEPLDNPCIIFPSKAYLALLTAARTQSPRETAGALVGIMNRAGSGQRVEIAQIHPIRLINKGLGLFPDPAEWEALRANLEETARQRRGGKRCLAGWYFADPGLGLFPPRIDLITVHQALSPDGKLFLLVNPATQAVGFFLWEDGEPAPVRGFYERLPNRLAESVIHWSAVLSEVPRVIRTTSADALDGPKTNPAGGTNQCAPESIGSTELPDAASAGVVPVGGFRNQHVLRSRPASAQGAPGGGQEEPLADAIAAPAEPVAHEQGDAPSSQTETAGLVMRAVVALLLFAGIFAAIFLYVPRTLPVAVASTTMTPPAAGVILRTPQAAAAPVASVTPVPTLQPTQRFLLALPVATRVVPPSPVVAASTSTPTAILPELSPTAMDRASLGRALVDKLVAAEAGLRTGQIDAVSETGQIHRSTARLIFDLGDARNPPRLYFLSTYQSGKSSQTVERISIAKQTWEQQTNGVWSAIDPQEEPWGQVHAFVPQAAAITEPEGTRDGRLAVLRWYDAGMDSDSVLQLDYLTGALQTWLQRTLATGTTFTVNYTGWNTPVSIPTPER
jgi:hypothetical protein